MSDSNRSTNHRSDSSAWDDPRVTAYVMQELADDQRASFEAELQSNPSLRDAVTQAQQVTEQLQELFAGETPNALEDQRRQQIMQTSNQSPGASVAATTPVSTAGNTAKPRRLTPWLLAAAATILLACGIAPALNKSRSVARIQPALPQSNPAASVDESTALIENPAGRQTASDNSKLESLNGPALNVLSDSVDFTEGLQAPLHAENKPFSPAIAPGSGSEKSVQLHEAAEEQFAFEGLMVEELTRPASKQLAQKNRELGTIAGKPGRPILSKKLSAGFVTEAKQPTEYYYRNLSQGLNNFSTLSLDQSRYETIVENEFQAVSEHPLSTFSIDVDTASYSKVRRTLLGGGLPVPDAVRIEELVNYFQYDYAAPAADAKHPFAANVTITSCPWNTEHRLARVAIQGKTITRQQRPPCNLVFLLDTSGSMNSPSKLPLVIEGMTMLTKQLGENDRVAIVVYAGSAGLVLDSTPANKHKKIKKALAQLSAGGSTNGGAGIQLAYATARDHFIKDGVNRVILCTDGDFNVGISGTNPLVDLVTEEASGGIFLTALGFGMDNHNDAMMEQISGKGNGNYAFIDTANEARKVLVRQTDATLVTIAKDVKFQLEFNPRLVSQYRLIGYENRVLAKEDFNDDKKDAGEIGAGHQVTALYELVPGDGSGQAKSSVDPLKYQSELQLSEAAAGDDTLTLKLRYKQPDGDTSTLVEFTARDDEQAFENADDNFKFAAAVASFGMQLRHSQFAGDWTLPTVAEVAAANLGSDEFELRGEFVQLVQQAIRLSDGR
ncbi:VWA domain-containing protein [Stieleria sp. TO1_6]|uniref:YfbK domain-containing protein n=1 Tax=Stieleria tagensis TaxID=2956795 RepID=UPI00209BB914|nr:von Willebrand factor type A domain-containing protein [Stieleria tagensis]MCO8124409.1 VWA domain-containing protein [Stieleria tagensis]